MDSDFFSRNIEILGSTLLHAERKLHHFGFIEMTEDEAARFANRTILELSGNLLSDTLLHLSLFTSGRCLVPHYEHIISHRIFYPGEIYIHADAVIADKLIELIENQNELVRIDHVLTCMSWIGTPNVIRYFLEASTEKPAWTKEIYLSPVQYAEVAGWTITTEEKKHSLISDNVIPLVNSIHTSDRSSLKTFVMHAEECSWCGNHLVTVFEFKEQAYSACLLCSCYGDFYMKLDAAGKSSWHRGNIRPDYLPQNTEMIVIPENTLCISFEHRNPSYSISQFTYNKKSQFGGYPTWIQDAAHMKCIDCNKTMLFAGQVDMSEVEEFGEGFYYFHLCPDCQVTGTNYQQT